MKHWTQRNGVWVESDQGVGIRKLDDVKQADGSTAQEWWIHLVNKDGTTLAAIPADRCSNVVIARRESIPAVRIEQLTDVQLTALGYV